MQAFLEGRVEMGWDKAGPDEKKQKLGQLLLRTLTEPQRRGSTSDDLAPPRRTEQWLHTARIQEHPASMAARQTPATLLRRALVTAATGQSRRQAHARWHSVGPPKRQQAIQTASVGDDIVPRILDTSTTKRAIIEGAPSEPVGLAFRPRIAVEIDGTPRTFDSVFLRDSCRCARCVDPSSTQKNFGTADIPETIEGSCQIDGPNAVMTWRNDVKDWPADHKSTIPLSFLRDALSQEAAVKAKKRTPPQRTHWTRDAMSAAIQFLPYEDYMSSDAILYKALHALRTHGLVFLKNVPDTSASEASASVTNIATRIGNLRDTFYGRTWDVRSIPDAKNVAYTHVYLALHMDLCYMDLTPHLQFLHSLRARAPGGESMFSDSFTAVEQIRRESPELFQALCSFPVTFHYFNDGFAYRQVRSTVELEDPADLSSPIRVVNWSPPFQGPFSNEIGTEAHGRELRVFHRAIRRFDELINREENLWERKMEEGDCVIFDNRRVLHARRAFDAARGERWLKGAYLDRDVYASKLRVLEDVYGR